MTETLRALSIRQPWAWLIVQGFKPVENRTWSTKFRGRFLIHAGQKFDRYGYEYVLKNFPAIFMPGTPGVFRRNDWCMGGIVGEADLVDCVQSHESKFFDGPFVFVLDNIKPTPFVPCKGALSFFTPKFAH